ncbi:MAG: hypothetical protein F6K00_30040 [Leptolyngbya sp. SIOISBB]|nr:hypothetical protein [Leptolyngbya sp. SIOISBB]
MTKFKSVNTALGQHPRLGPFPAHLLLPLLIAAGIAYFGYAVFGLTLMQAFFLGMFLLATWWLTTGGNSFRFISRFSRWFKPRWIRGAQPHTRWTLTNDTTIQTTKARHTR